MNRLPGFTNRGSLVPERGLEPPLPCENYLLKLARLPIPPFGHSRGHCEVIDCARPRERLSTRGPARCCSSFKLGDYPGPEDLEPAPESKSINLFTLELANG